MSLDLEAQPATMVANAAAVKIRMDISQSDQRL
jgi:hypothetical protein